MKKPVNKVMLDGKLLLQDVSSSFEYSFSEESIKSLSELGSILGRIHKRILSEGYTVRDGKILPPKNENV